jgi:putative component of toxin-antitoxin plasmid stabilization module
VLPSGVAELRYYLAGDGKSPFEDWFSGLDAAAAAKVSVALARLKQGNTSSLKGVGEGDFGMPDRFRPRLPGLSRLGRESAGILLTGGTKKRQQRDGGASRAADRRQLWS